MFGLGKKNETKKLLTFVVDGFMVYLSALNQEGTTFRNLNY